MSAKTSFARTLGGVTGLTVAVSMPHIGCLAALTPLFAGAGLGPDFTTGATYAAGGLTLAAGVAAARHGFASSANHCTAAACRKGLSLAAFGLAAGLLLNTVTDNGPAIADRAFILDAARQDGQSVWENNRALDASCVPGARFSWSMQ